MFIDKTKLELQNEWFELREEVSTQSFLQNKYTDLFRFIKALVVMDFVVIFLFGLFFFLRDHSILSFVFFIVADIFVLTSYFLAARGASMEQGVSLFLITRLFVISLLLGQNVVVGPWVDLYIFSFPMVAFFTKGKTGGLKWTIGIFLVFLGNYLMNFWGLAADRFDFSFVVRVLSVISLEMFFLWFYEYVRERHLSIIRGQLYHDELTGVFNRNSLLKDIDAMIAPGLVLVNIDDFREINDVFGYRVGDFVLMEFSKKIREFIPPDAKGPYRVSADEFAVLEELYGKNDPDAELEDLVQRSADWSSREWIEPGDYKIQLQVTAGVANSLMVGTGNLVTRADIALKTAKKQKKSFLFYKQAVQTKKDYEENIKWAKILTDALKENRVTAFYQPILNNHTNKIEKFECLVRLIEDSGKVITPCYFLDIAKKSRQYSKITRIVVQDAMKTFGDIEAEFSVNLSLEDILDASTREFLNVAMEIYPDVAKRVVFEILESDGIENYDEVSMFIRKMRGYGCQFAVDDFGTGYSNFSHILKLDVDYLKIDGSLIKKLDMDYQSAIVVENIVSFSSKLGLKTIAEFVHSESVLNKVKELGINYSQGYWIDEPLDKPRFS